MKEVRKKNYATAHEGSISASITSSDRAAIDVDSTHLLVYAFIEYLGKIKIYICAKSMCSVGCLIKLLH